MKKYVNVEEQGDSYCLSAINAINVTIPNQENMFVLGDLFMQKYYTVFDRDNDRIGLALAKQEGEEMVYILNEANMNFDLSKHR